MSSVLSYSMYVNSGTNDKWDICTAAQPNWKIITNAA